MRFLLLPLALIPLLTACGGGDGGGSVRGQVNDTERRLCVIDDDNLTKPFGDRVARCFEAADDVLAGYQVGDCVKVDYETLGDAQLPRVSSVARTEGCPAPATGR